MIIGECITLNAYTKRAKLLVNHLNSPQPRTQEKDTIIPKGSGKEQKSIKGKNTIEKADIKIWLFEKFKIDKLLTRPA